MANESIWPSNWRVPRSIPYPATNGLFVLEPLGERHAERDFAALTSCRGRLRGELQWGEWPSDDFTLEENRTDLRRHQSKFENGVAFAYSVLEPDRSRVLGCIYIESCEIEADVQLAFWVIDDAIAIELELVSTVLRWLHNEWNVNRVAIPLRDANARGLKLVNSLGCRSLDRQTAGRLSGFRCFLSERWSETA